MPKSRTTYGVQKVVGQREQQGKVFYKVHWAKFSSAHDSWEPAENLSECQELIDEYIERQAAINRRRSLRSHSHEPQRRQRSLQSDAREPHSVTGFSSDEEGSPVRRQIAKRQTTRSPAKQTTKSSARTPPAGKETVVADSDISKQPQTIGLFAASYNFHSTNQSQPAISANLAALSSDEEIGAVSSRMTLTESKIRKRIAEVSFVPTVAVTSTPNAKTSFQSTSMSIRSSSRVKTRLQVGMRQEHITKEKPAELSVCEEANDADSYPAEATPAQEQPPSELPPPPPATTDDDDRRLQKVQKAKDYPSWMQVGWKEVALAGVMSGIAALGYACYYSDYCNYC